MQLPLVAMVLREASALMHISSIIIQLHRLDPVPRRSNWYNITYYFTKIISVTIYSSSAKLVSSPVASSCLKRGEKDLSKESFLKILVKHTFLIQLIHFMILILVYRF